MKTKRTWNKQVATVYGWGNADLQDADTDNFEPIEGYESNSFCLQKTYLTVLSEKECKRRWGGKGTLAASTFKFKSHHMCASKSFRWRWRDGCPGDEGAPLTIRATKTKNLLVGVFVWSLRIAYVDGQFERMCGGHNENQDRKQV